MTVANVRLNIYIGNINGYQVWPFFHALESMPNYRQFEIRKLFRKDIAHANWTPKTFVDWLLDNGGKKSVYIILTHPRQGLECLLWNTETLKNELLRLNGNIGFPKKVHCPMFLQDKYDYIGTSPNLFIPTLKLPLTKDGSFTQNHVDNILEFAEKLNYPVDWVMKLPYSTNGKDVRHIHSLDALQRHFKNQSFMHFEELPYIMLQPELPNRREWKIIFYGDKDQYEAYYPEKSVS